MPSLTIFIILIISILTIVGVGILLIRVTRKYVRPGWSCELIVALIRSVFFGIGIVTGGHGFIIGPFIFSFFIDASGYWPNYIVSVSILIVSMSVYWIKLNLNNKDVMRRNEK